MSAFAPKRILAPIDLSAGSAKIVEWAGLFARAFGSSLEVFHADWVDAPPYFTAGQVAELAAQRAAHRHALEQMLTDLVSPILGPEIRWSTRISEGRPITEIEKRIDEAPPDLMALGSHGRSGAARVLLGSVAENVIRHSTSPLLIVPARFPKDRRPAVRSILCPVNFTDSARRCVEASAELASQFDATLQVVHSAEDRSTDLDEVRQRLCVWLPSSVRSRCSVTEIVREGDAAEQIIKAAKVHDSDLIALTAEHRPFLEWSTIGTTTVRVMRHSEIPVLMLPVKA